MVDINSGDKLLIQYCWDYIILNINDTSNWRIIYTADSLCKPENSHGKIISKTLEDFKNVIFNYCKYRWKIYDMSSSK